MSDEESSIGEGVGQVVPHRLQNGPPQTSTSELAAGLSRWMDASNSFIYVELASLVLMFACVADWYPTLWYKYALSVAVVSLSVCLILQTVEFLIPGFLEWVVIKEREDGSGGHTVQKIASVLMLIWWIFGTGFITFKGEYEYYYYEVSLWSVPHCTDQCKSNTLYWNTCNTQHLFGNT